MSFSFTDSGSFEKAYFMLRTYRAVIEKINSNKNGTSKEELYEFNEIKKRGQYRRWMTMSDGWKPSVQV